MRDQKLIPDITNMAKVAPMPKLGILRALDNQQKNTATRGFEYGAGVKPSNDRAVTSLNSNGGNVQAALKNSPDVEPVNPTSMFTQAGRANGYSGTGELPANVYKGGSSDVGGKPMKQPFENKSVNTNSNGVDIDIKPKYENPNGAAPSTISGSLASAPKEDIVAMGNDALRDINKPSAPSPNTFSQDTKGNVLKDGVAIPPKFPEASTTGAAKPKETFQTFKGPEPLPKPDVPMMPKIIGNSPTPELYDSTLDTLPEKKDLLPLTAATSPLAREEAPDMSTAMTKKRSSRFTGMMKGGILKPREKHPIGKTDTVPAMLTPGEFVVKKDAVDKVGEDFLRDLNAGKVQGYALEKTNDGEVKPKDPTKAYQAWSDELRVKNAAEKPRTLQTPKTPKMGDLPGMEEIAQKVKLNPLVSKVPEWINNKVTPEPKPLPLDPTLANPQSKELVPVERPTFKPIEKPTVAGTALARIGEKDTARHSNGSAEPVGQPQKGIFNRFAKITPEVSAKLDPYTSAINAQPKAPTPEAPKLDPQAQKVADANQARVDALRGKTTAAPTENPTENPTAAKTKTGKLSGDALKNADSTLSGSKVDAEGGKGTTFERNATGASPVAGKPSVVSTDTPEMQRAKEVDAKNVKSKIPGLGLAALTGIMSYPEIKKNLTKPGAFDLSKPLPAVDTSDEAQANRHKELEAQATTPWNEYGKDYAALRKDYSVLPAAAITAKNNLGIPALMEGGKELLGDTVKAGRELLRTPSGDAKSVAPATQAEKPVEETAQQKLIRESNGVFAPAGTTKKGYMSINEATKEQARLADEYYGKAQAINQVFGPGNTGDLKSWKDQVAKNEADKKAYAEYNSLDAKKARDAEVIRKGIFRNELMADKMLASPYAYGKESLDAAKDIKARAEKYREQDLTKQKADADITDRKAEREQKRADVDYERNTPKNKLENTQAQSLLDVMNGVPGAVEKHTRGYKALHPYGDLKPEEADDPAFTPEQVSKYFKDTPLTQDQNLMVTSFSKADKYKLSKAFQAMAAIKDPAEQERYKKQLNDDWNRLHQNKIPLEFGAKLLGFPSVGDLEGVQ